MKIRKVKPFTKQEIDSTDTLTAKYLLLDELCQIPEFVDLWNKARLEVKPTMEAISSRLKERFLALSQEAKEILSQSAGSISQSHENGVVDEVQRYVNYLHAFQSALEKDRDITDIVYSYKSQIKALVEPLGIPDFHDDMLLWDTQFWGFNNIFPGLFDIYTNNSLESQILREATELRPAELAITRPLEVQKRAMRKVSTLRKHHSRYLLRQRIRLWVHNVVLGKTQEKIAVRVQDDKEWFQVGENPFEWVRKQIHDANRILGVVRKGRPPKGGVLRQWKMMLE